MIRSALALKLAIGHLFCELAKLIRIFEGKAAVWLGADTAVLSGGVFQNDLLLADVASCLESTRIQLWTNRDVPPNDGGISLGQAALSLEHSGS